MEWSIYKASSKGRRRYQDQKMKVLAVSNVTKLMEIKAGPHDSFNFTATNFAERELSATML